MPPSTATTSSEEVVVVDDVESVERIINGAVSAKLWDRLVTLEGGGK